MIQLMSILGLNAIGFSIFFGIFILILAGYIWSMDDDNFKDLF